MKKYQHLLQSIMANKAQRKFALLILILVGLSSAFLAVYLMQRGTRAAGLVTLQFQAPTASIGVGATARIPILINAPGLAQQLQSNPPTSCSNPDPTDNVCYYAFEHISAADLKISFPANLIEVVSLTTQTSDPFLPTVLAGPAINNTAGTASLTMGAVTNHKDIKKAPGILAVLTVRGKAAGSATLAFGTQTQIAAIGRSGNVIDTTSGSTDIPTATVTVASTQTTSGAALNFGTAPSTISVGTNFTIPVQMNTNSIATDAVNAVIEYDSTKLEFVSAAAGTTFDTYNQSGLKAGTGTLRQVVFEALMQVDNGTGISGSAVGIGTITFRPLVAGSTTLKILCSDATGANCNPLDETYSQVSQYGVEGEGILTSAGQVTLTVGAATSPTPTPTTAPGVTNTPTPTRTPTPTLTNTPTPTPSLAPKQIGFKLKLSGSGTGTIPATFVRPMKVTINSSPAISLNMTGDTVPTVSIPSTGTVAVTLQPEGYLPVTLTISNPAALSGTVDLTSLVTFIGGNVDNADSLVNSVDAATYIYMLKNGAAPTSQPQSTMVSGDQNSSSKVTVLDYSSILNNINKQGLSITLN